jgi:hypothetical protein
MRMVCTYRACDFKLSATHGRWAASCGRLVALAAALTLSGCVSVATLPDGQSSIMSAPSNQQRAQLMISAVPTSVALNYRPFKNCSYHSSSVGFGQPSHQTDGQLTARKIRDRLLLVDDSDGAKSSILMDASGQIFDFNLTDSKGVQHTGDTQSGDQYSYMFPQFNQNALKPGDVAANVKTKDGKVMGSYLYRGTTQMHGMNGFVLDFVAMAPNTSYGALLTGFDVVESRTMVPLLLVTDAQGNKIQIETNSCTL